MAHFSEMEFLFVNSPRTTTSTEATTNINNAVGNNERSIYSMGSNNETYYVFKGPWGPRGKITRTRRFKDKDGKEHTTTLDENGISIEGKSGYQGNQVKNYAKTAIYDKSSNNNPYVDLIRNFDGGKSSAKSLLIKASDLAYLKELGVYPINRMVILRRFQEGQSVPEKLDELDAIPISTFIGWLKEDENFGNYSFNESWTQTSKRLDELLTDMIKENFAKNSPIKSIMPVPSFARGLLFGLMKQMGIVGDSGSPWDWNNIPIGDPNVLQEGPYRDPSNQNIQSSMQFTFETTYEQKFIGDVDPGAAMIDVIDNLLKMGTSDMKYWLNGNSGLVQDAKNAVGGDDINYWWLLVKNVVLKLWSTIKETIASISSFIDNSSISEIASAGKTVFEEFLQSVMTATVAKYRWELKGSMELMTGDGSTPWYLTIGNPYSPWLATNHILVNKVEIETSNELGFNDMPMWLKAKITVSQSRHLGRNEIIKMFNNSFLREYSKYNKPSVIVEVDNLNVPSSSDPEKGGSGSSTESSQQNNTTQKYGPFSAEYLDANQQNTIIENNFTNTRYR